MIVKRVRLRDVVEEQMKLKPTFLIYHDAMGQYLVHRSWRQGVRAQAVEFPTRREAAKVLGPRARHGWRIIVEHPAKPERVKPIRKPKIRTVTVD